MTRGIRLLQAPQHKRTDAPAARARSAVWPPTSGRWARRRRSAVLVMFECYTVRRGRVVHSTVARPRTRVNRDADGRARIRVSIAYTVHTHTVIGSYYSSRFAPATR